MGIPHYLKINGFAVDHITICVSQVTKDFCSIKKKRYSLCGHVIFGAQSNFQTRLRLAR